MNERFLWKREFIYCCRWELLFVCYLSTHTHTHTFTISVSFLI